MGIDPAMPDLGDAVPRLHGRPVRVADYFADVMLGYRRMGQCLAQRADALTADDGPLGRTAGVPVRFVYRNTHIYVRLLAESVRPARLRDGVDRARCLDRLWLAHAPGGAPAAIHAAEVAALRDGDIPLFTARTDRWELETSLGVTVPNVCEGSALARARSRLRSLAAGGAAAERDAIRTALFTLRPDVRMTPRGGRAARGTSGRSGDDNAWLSAACAIGDAIRRSAIPVPGGEWTWIGVQYGASTGAWRYGQLAPELLSGTAGLAIVFADLYRLSGLSRFQHAARRTLPLILRRLAAGPTDGGGFLGWGAAFYAGYRCAVALSDFVLASAIVDQALELLMASPLQEHTTRDAADVVRGQPGLLLALLSARSATRAAQYVASVGITGRAGAVVRPGPLEGLPGPAAATALARQRLAAITGVSDRTPCWTLPAPQTTGNILAHLDSSRHEPAMRDAAIWGARATVAALRRTGRTRALVEAVDVAVTAWQVSGASRDLVAARASARALIDRNRRTGQWFPDLLAADRHNLSVVTGVGAVAHALMRVHAPEQVASVRLLEASC
jgi:class II lanthipeptide synthase